MNNKVLIITCSGGGGLIQAAQAKEQQVKNLNSDAVIFKRDVLRDWVWKRLGTFSIDMWDKAQRKGNIKTLEWLIHQQKLAEYLFWPSVFFSVLFLLFKVDFDRVIDTQPIGTSAILKAIRLYNYFKKKKLFLEKVVVDLPTKKACHFFQTIKKLSKKDKKSLQLVTVTPILEKDETEESFWMKYTDLSKKNIIYEEYYVRNSFQKYQRKKRVKEDFIIRIAVKSKEEKSWIIKAYKKGTIQVTFHDDHFNFMVGEKDVVFTILLGSQPAFDATLSYVSQVIETFKKKPLKNPFHVFVFCADHEDGQETLFKKVYHLIENTKNLPDLLTIIPVSFQNEEVIAPLFFRSDLTCTKSGGQTSMELMSVMKGSMFVHSEAKISNSNKKPDLELLLSGIAGWEAGNACYLQKKRGAKIITPHNFLNYFESFLDRFR